MKIAQIAPPWVSVPPKYYGGTESVIHNLTEELVKRGHDVTLFATGDSKTKAKLSYIYRKPFGIPASFEDDPYLVLPHYLNALKKAGDFDIIHNHSDDFTLVLTDLIETPVVHTLHDSFVAGDLDSKKVDLVKKFSHYNYVSISYSQRKQINKINFIGNVYNGINLDHFKFSARKGDYLLWLGRVGRAKGAFDAIKTARKLKMDLVLAGPIDYSDSGYLERHVMPYVDGKKIKYIGEVNQNEKVSLYKNAFCTLSPIQWSEPYGLVMVESMACGTPVVVYDRGAAREVVKDKVSGFVVAPWEGVAGLSEAVKNVQHLDRRSAREWVASNFTRQKMATGYEQIYEKILGITKAYPAFRYSH